MKSKQEALVMIRINNCKKRNKRLKGMTLIEIMIALSIIGVLSAIAYPAYTDYVLKSHRIAALSDMSKMQLTLESTYDSGYKFSEVANSSGVCTICESSPSRYILSVTSDASNVYIIKATAQPDEGQKKDSCIKDEIVKEMKITASNVTSPPSCWD